MKSVLITGGASGLGLAMAHEYAAQGYKLCIADMQVEQGQQVVKDLNEKGAEAIFFELDVRSDEQWLSLHNEIAQRWKGLDVLINNAGVAASGLIEEQSIVDWQWILDINVMGVVRGCKTFTPLMKKKEQGSIINIASMAGLLHGASMSAYNVSKASVVALSETLRIELESWNISGSVVCPAFFKTNLTDNMRTNNPGVKKAVDNWMKTSGIQAEDIARMVYLGMEKQQFFILTHRREKMLWWVKRLSPNLLFRLMIKATRIQLKRTGGDIK